MADYQEGHILTNKESGDRVQLQDGQWVSIGPTTSTDLKRSTFPSLIRGGVNLVTSPIEMGSQAAKAVSKIGMPEDAPPREAPLWTDPAAAIREAVEKGVGGENGMYVPKTTPGKYYGAVLEAAPGMALGGGGGAANIGRNAVKTITGALGGEAAGQTAENMGGSQWWRVPGTLAGTLLPSILRRGATPNPILDPVRRQQVQDTRDAGINVAATQAKGGGWLAPIENYWRNRLPDSAGWSDRAQQRGISDVLMRSTGAASGIAPLSANVRHQAATLGSEREALAAGMPKIPFDTQFQGDVSAATNRARASLRLPAASRVPGISDTTDALFRDPATGKIRMGMTGPEYLEQRTNLRTAGTGAGVTPAARQAHFDMRNALDAAAERTQPGFNRIHEQMANTRALEQVMGRDNPQAQAGIANAGAFSQAHSNPAATTPTLARSLNAATEVPHGLPGTGYFPGGVSALVAAYLAHKYGFTGGVPESLIAGTVTGGPMGHLAVHNPVAARLGLSAPVQGYLGNQRFLPSNDPGGNIARTVKILAGSSPLRDEVEGYQ